MWLCNSSVGRKVVMSVTGLALVLFLTFHACMNVVAIFSKDGYNAICEFLGSNWYAVAGTVALGALVVIHFVFAIMLTLQNRKARGASRYEETSIPEKVEWASQNMLVLGLIVCLGLLLHLYNFWWNMMAAELLGFEQMAHSPSDGYAWIAETFSNPVFAVLYLVWFCALWFHLTHGIWSGLQTLGASGKVWFSRIKCISWIWSTVVILMYVTVVVFFFAKSLCCPEAACYSL